MYNVCMARFERRTLKIKSKYGKDAFVKWGRLGGNPVLLAQAEGRLTIHRKRKA